MAVRDDEVGTLLLGADFRLLAEVDEGNWKENQDPIRLEWRLDAAVTLLMLTGLGDSGYHLVLHRRDCRTGRSHEVD